jgi:hypothetical protein
MNRGYLHHRSEGEDEDFEREGRGDPLFPVEGSLTFHNRN